MNLIYENLKEYFDIAPKNLNLKNINLDSRYDDKKTILIKRLLQNHLPINIRQKITNKIFQKILNISESDFAKKTLYGHKTN